MPRVTFILAAALLFAPIASADTLNACAKQKDGKLRLVADLGQCRNNEAPISWESEGPQGPAGSQGTQGPAGPQGDPAPAAPAFELVGFTSTTHFGDTGFLGFNRACVSEFPGSRMCRSLEVIDTVGPPDNLSGTAWVNPTWVPALAGSSLRDAASGVVGSSTTMMCGHGNQTTNEPEGGWAIQGNFAGLAFDGDGIFDLQRCDEQRAVACCAPAP